MPRIIKYYSLASILLFLLALLTCSYSPNNSSVTPNIIFILADDLGYGEIGAYGQQKIETPNIDALARDGMIYNNFYTGAPVCAPARCVFLTGMHSGHADIRGNDEAGYRGAVWDYKAMASDPGLEGQAPMLDSIVTIAEVLKSNGYTTALFGKWGLGYPGSESTPNKQGFDYFYGYNCQRQAHTLRPLFLYQNENRVPLLNDTIAPHTKLPASADSFSVQSYSPFNNGEYAPESIFKHLTNFISSNLSNPFFIYWATPIPHLPLQAPINWVNYYVKKFGDEPPYTGNRGYFPTRFPRATYAAMISYLDENIGKMISQLKSNGLYENTLIVFTSDNGPSYTGGTDSPWFRSGGPYNSEYGWGKGFLREGGIKVPLIACWPNKIKAGTFSNRLSGMQDLFPSFLETAQISYPKKLDGLSLLKDWTGRPDSEQHPYLYWEYPEYGGQRALRWGHWKAYNHDLKNGNTAIEIYDLAPDPEEKYDLSNKHPALVKFVESVFIKEHIPSRNSRWRYDVLDGISQE